MTSFVRFGPLGAEKPAVIVDGRTFDLTSMTGDLDGAFLQAGGLVAAREVARAGGLPEIDIAGERLGAPVARPQAVICIGQNYAAHAAESGSPVPTSPIVFFKHPACIVGAFDDVHLPPGSTRTDWEVELAAVMGTPARYLSDEQSALECVAGYTVSNDVSEREWQVDFSGGQWSKGKSFETFNPLGPYLVPADEVRQDSIRLRSSVNGEPRQDSSTADMVFSVARLVLDLSQFLVLQPGDVINTGTPEGVALSGRFPYLGLGDVMEIEIDGLGAQRQTVVAAPYP